MNQVLDDYRKYLILYWAMQQTVKGAPSRDGFVLGGSDRELVTFAGGSGITPVFSLIRSALAVTTRRVRLFYANRSRDSVIFADSLALLAERHPDRLLVQHHLDEDNGVVRPAEIESFLAAVEDAEFYICGPRAFMDTVEAAVLGTGAAADRVHLERFDISDAALSTDTVTEEVTVQLGRRKTVVPYRAGNTVLQTARMAGLQAPSSCETGSCATCMARLVEGTVRMINNDALTEEEVADGWVPTCQSMPTSRSVRVVYE